MKFKKGIIVEGHGNLGKTTLIGHIRDELVANASVEYIHKYRINDFISIVSYQGKKILIISGGDNSIILENAFIQLEKNGYSRDNLYSDIDFVLGAARSNGGTHDFWENEIMPPIIWVSKSYFNIDITENNKILASIYTDLLIANL